MAFQIQVNFADNSHSEALEVQVREAIDQHITERFGERLTRIEVHLGDENSPKKSSETDKRCMIEARPRGRDPIIVEEHAGDWYVAAKSAAKKLQRALESRLEKD